MKVAVHGEPVKEGKKGPDKWEVENWVRTIHDAEEIKSDPEKMKHCRPMLMKKGKAAIKTMEQLRKHAKDMQELESASEDKAEGGVEE